METLQFSQHHFMFSSLKLHPHSLLILRTHCSSVTKSFCTSPSSLASSTLLNLKSLEIEIPNSAQPPPKPKRTSRSKNANGSELKEFHAQLKENWLVSLSGHEVDVNDNGNGNEGSTCVVGIDPDLSGALAFLKTDHLGSSAQVFDTPHLKALVGTRTRKRLDARSIVELLRSLNAPVGTKAYIEQSIPYPQDGKQGWWSGGFGYGLWIGVLVASGFSVVPVPSALWKNKFELTGGCKAKDESRRVACTLFPSMSTLLKRKKDHGRAEALLIAAYGKGIRIKSASPKSPDCMTEEILN